MRPVVEPYELSTKDDILSARERMDETGSFASYMEYAENLTKSESQEDVEKALDYLNGAVKFSDINELLFEVFELKILAYYRLGRDKECKEQIKLALKNNCSTCVINYINAEFNEKDHEKKVKAFVAVGAISAIAAATLTFVNRKKK